MISREEWEEVKRRIRALPDAHVPYTFCDEFICACRADTPKRLLDKWGDKNRKPCPAGKTFGVIGPNGLYPLEVLHHERAQVHEGAPARSTRSRGARR